ETAATWLNGITTARGDNGLRAFEQSIYTDDTDRIHRTTKAPIGHWLESGLAIITTNFAEHFRAFSDFVESVVESVELALLWPHWSVIIALFGMFVFALHRSLRLMVLVMAGLLLIVNLGLWVETVKTLVMVTFASCIAVGIGIPLGVIAAERPRFYTLLRPLLDLMQTIPTFVYLIPSLMLFGLGLVPGLISTVIF